MKIYRPNVDVQPFASQSKTEERTVFGSKEITDKLEKNLNSDFYRGWGIVPVSELPTSQDFNAVEFTVSSLVTHLYQNGIAEYAEKQIYNKGAVCLFEGDIYKSITDNNAGNPLTDKTQWQSLKNAILDAIVVQQTGNNADKVMSQKSVTDSLNGKQPKGDYATKMEMNNALSGKQPNGDYSTKTELNKGLNTTLKINNNLSDIKNKADARNNLGLGTAALLKAATGIAKAYGHIFIPAIIDGEAKKFMFQWMTVGLDKAEAGKMATKTVNWTTPFPNACLVTLTSLRKTSYSTNGSPVTASEIIDKFQVEVASGYNSSPSTVVVFGIGY